MKVKRIVANVSASAPNKAKSFYQDLLGLEGLMDMGWIITYGSRATPTVARKTLRDLERDGLVSRRVHAVVPLRVD